MRRARIAQGLTQDQLGGRVGLSQTMISDIETGEVGSSSAVMAISKTLRIPPPWLAVEDEVDERWLDVGRVLRRHRPRAFEKWLQLLMEEVEHILGADSDDGSGGTKPQ